MKFIQGHSRNQINLFPVSLDQSIDPDNEVRIIDLFVDSLSIKDYGFRMDYNVQTTVDSKNNIPIDYKVTNQNDSKAMGNMVQRAKSILGCNDFTALYDKGYHTGSDVGFMFIAFNLRRIISILGKDQMMEYLRILVLLFLTISSYFRRKISRLKASVFKKIICHWQLQLSLRSL